MERSLHGLQKPGVVRPSHGRRVLSLAPSLFFFCLCSKKENIDVDGGGGGVGRYDVASEGDGKVEHLVDGDGHGGHPCKTIRFESFFFPCLPLPLLLLASFLSPSGSCLLC